MRTLKIIPLLAGMVLLFTYCQKDAFDPQPASQDNPVINMKDVPAGDDCLIIQELWAGAGQNDTLKGTKVGYVSAEIDWAEMELLVTYNMFNGWMLTEAHLWVGSDLADIPKNAAPGQFPYKVFDYDQTFVIDLDGFAQYDMIYVAAHGVVSGMGQYLDLNEVFPLDVTVHLSYHGHYPGFSDSYFKVDISEGGLLDGSNYNGWCLDLSTPIDFDEIPYGATAYLSTGYIPAELGINVDNLPYVNWVLNNIYVGLEDYTLQDIQVAIWYLMTEYDEEYFNQNAADLGVTGFNWTRVMAIVELAMDHGDFVPGCGDVVGVILVSLDPLQQNIIIPIPVPCEMMGEETLWAYGEHPFNETVIGYRPNGKPNYVANKWGWAFEVDLGACPINGDDD